MKHQAHEDDSPEGLTPRDGARWVDARQRARVAQRAKARARAKVSAVQLAALKREWKQSASAQPKGGAGQGAGRQGRRRGKGRQGAAGGRTGAEGPS